MTDNSGDDDGAAEESPARGALAEDEDPAGAVCLRTLVDNGFLDRLTAAEQFQKWEQQYPAP